MVALSTQQTRLSTSVLLPGTERDSFNIEKRSRSGETCAVCFGFFFVMKDEAAYLALVGATSVDDVGVIFMAKDVVEDAVK